MSIDENLPLSLSAISILMLATHMCCARHESRPEPSGPVDGNVAPELNRFQKLEGNSLTEHRLFVINTKNDFTVTKCQHFEYFCICDLHNLVKGNTPLL